MELIAANYANREDAEAALKAVEQNEWTVHVDLFDAAVLVAGADGKVDLHDQHSRSTLKGAVGGGIVGLFAAALFPPAFLGELLLGVVGGAVGGHFSGHKDRDEFRSFADNLKLEPGAAAVVLLLEADSDLDPVMEALAGSSHIARSTLTPEESSELREAF